MRNSERYEEQSSLSARIGTILGFIGLALGIAIGIIALL